MADETIFGYFDGPAATPTFDPGVGAPCPACSKPVTKEGVRSQSVLVPGDYRCYFFRYHIACADDPKVQEAEHWIVDNRVKVADALNEADGKTSDEALREYIAPLTPNHRTHPNDRPG